MCSTWLHRLKLDPETRLGRLGETLKGARRWLHPAAFQAGNDGLRCPHSLGNLLLRHVGLRAGRNEGGSKVELALQGIIGGPELRVLAPLPERFFGGYKLPC